MEWSALRETALTTLQTGRAAAVTTATGYIGAVLAETNQHAEPVGELNPARFLATMPDGRDPAGFVDVPVQWAREGITGGLTVPAALAQAGNMLTAVTLTVLADTRRDVYGADIAQRPTVTGYTRMLNPPSCARCVILAGKWFRWNEGFLRHPRCDCQHVPAAENIAGDLRTDPYEYFESLTAQQQEKVFGRIEVRAIRDGADIYRVVNIRRRGLATAAGARRYGTPHRLTLDDIYRVAGTRTNAIRLMRQEGYITERGQRVIARSPGVRTDAEILAAGRGRNTYRVGAEMVTPARASRFDAARSGTRDPLNRATMTAAERRLYDANYRLEFARRTGQMPLSIGMNSADAHLGPDAGRGVADIPALQRALAAELAGVRAGSSLDRLARALGLRT